MNSKTLKTQTSGPKPTSASTAQQPKLKKVSTLNSSSQTSASKAALTTGKVAPEKAVQAKSPKTPTLRASEAQDSNQDAASAPTRSRRKPRKLNKDPTSASTQKQTTTTKGAAEDTDATASVELEALKSRVRGLEAKVEQLYSSAETKGARSPRRRGKGRKASSSTQPPVPNTTSDSTAKAQEVGVDEDEIDEDIVRLEGELEVARQDLEAFRPRIRRSLSQGNDEIEEIPRQEFSLEDAGKGNTNRHVTLSGSYRIPLPTSVSMDDVRTIQNGVSAAQNVARSFFEQRRAAASVREQQNQHNSPSSRAARTTTPKAMSSSMEVAVANDGEGRKQSWGEWIGGYSMAISRAVKNIEHEALVQSQAAENTTERPAKTSARSSRVGNTSMSKKQNAGNKRRVAQATLSSEQVQGLMG